MNNIRYESNMELFIVIIVVIALVYIFQYTISKWSFTKIRVAELEQNKVVHHKSERIYPTLPELTEDEKKKIDKEMEETITMQDVGEVVFDLMGEGDENVKENNANNTKR